MKDRKGCGNGASSLSCRSINVDRPMRYTIQEDFLVRTVAGEHVLIGGGRQINFSRLLILSETAAFLVRALQQAPCTAEELVEKLQAAYEVDAPQARADVAELLQTLLRLKVAAELRP